MLITTQSNKTEEFVSSFLKEDQGILETHSHLRNESIEKLKTQDFPTTKEEYWKYTRTSKIAKLNLQLCNGKFTFDHDKSKIDNLDAYHVVFQNGFLKKDLSDWHLSSDIAIIQTFSEFNQEELATLFGKSLDTDKNIFNTLNSAYFTDGLVIKIKGKLDKPIHIIHELTGENILAQPRIIIISEKNGEGLIVNSSSSENATNILFNPVYEFFIGENSQVEFVNIQGEEDGVFNITNSTGNQDKSSTLTLHHYALNGDWIRNNTDILVNGENCQTNLYGAYVAKNKQLIDNHTMIDHKVANCESNELYKGTATDKATVTFNGKVFVRKDAQKINAFQSNNNILLSDDATINSKPELEIYADDVKCSHGSTTGQLDEDALFYLQSRGLSKNSARELLIGAFIGEVVEEITHETIKDHVKTLYGLS